MHCIFHLAVYQLIHSWFFKSETNNFKLNWPWAQQEVTKVKKVKFWKIVEIVWNVCNIDISSKKHPQTMFFAFYSCLELPNFQIGLADNILRQLIGYFWFRGKLVSAWRISFVCLSVDSFNVLQKWNQKFQIELTLFAFWIVYWNGNLIANIKKVFAPPLRDTSNMSCPPIS